MALKTETCVDRNSASKRNSRTVCASQFTDSQSYNLQCTSNVVSVSRMPKNDGKYSSLHVRNINGSLSIEEEKFSVQESCKGLTIVESGPYSQETQLHSHESYREAQYIHCARHEHDFLVKQHNSPTALLRTELTKLCMAQNNAHSVFHKLLSFVGYVYTYYCVFFIQLLCNTTFTKSICHSMKEKAYKENTVFFPKDHVSSDHNPTEQTIPAYQVEIPPGDIKKEAYRLSTYTKFPPFSPVKAFSRYAKAGFYYTGNSDVIKCFSCTQELRDFSSDFDPFLLKHHKPNCRFARNLSHNGNIPIHNPGFSASSSASYPAHNAGQLLTPRPVTYQSASVVPFAMRNVAQRSVPSSSRARQAIPSTSATALMRPLATISDPNHERLVRSLDLCQEAQRLQTYNNWPSTQAPAPGEMARSGFFYLGNLDRVQCFSCGGVLRNWNSMDNPETEHSTHFPHCRRVQGVERQNVASVEHENFRPPERPLSMQEQRDLRIMFPCQHPANINMQHLEQRLSTFGEWPYTRARPIHIAEAGFYSLGLRDRVKCYYCGGGLQSFRGNDNPWEEHAKWFPNCEFVLQRKGPAFVHDIVARFPNLDRPVLENYRATTQSTPVTRHQPRTQSQQSFTNEPVSVQATSLLEQAMENEAAKGVIEMGFEAEEVQQVMRTRMENGLEPYTSASELLDAVLQLQSRQSHPEPSSSTPSSHIASVFTQQEASDDDELDIYTSVEDVVAQETGDLGQTLPALSFGQAGSISIPESHQPTPVDLSDCGPASTSAARHSPPVDMETTGPPEARRSSLRDLQRRLQDLKNDRICKVCLDRQAEVLFVPCGHICCCVECAGALRTCPVCRVKIDKAVRTYTHR